jgi:beta-lactamase class A
MGASLGPRMNRRRLHPCCLLVTVALATLAANRGHLEAQTAPAAPSIQQRIDARIKAFGGEMGVAAINLKSGETIAVSGDTRFPTASLIKVPVMVEVFHQIAAGALRRDTTLTLRDRDKVGDETVVLNQLHDGLLVSVADLLALMTAYSDNTATNLLVGLVTTAKVDARIESYGLKNMLLFRPTFRDGHADVHPELEREFGLGMTSPRDMATLFAHIAEGRVVDRTISDEIVALLDRQQDRAMIPRSLPYARDRVIVGNKTGWDAEKKTSGRTGQIRTDAAYVRSDRARYVICICARSIRDPDTSVDNEALRVGAAISREIYDYFAGK